MRSIKVVINILLIIAISTIIGCNNISESLSSDYINISSEDSEISKINEDNIKAQYEGENKEMIQKSEIVINIEIEKQNFKGILYDNETTQCLLEKFPLIINMSDLNSNEKYYYLKEDMPTNSKVAGKINSGDIMLFGANCLVLFYEDFSSSYSYTRLGYIENKDELSKALGSGNVQVKFSR